MWSSRRRPCSGREEWSTQKFHDTSPALPAFKDGLPEKEVSFLAKASEELSRKRALAMYGDEARGLGPDEIFEEEEAREAYDTAAESLRYAAGWHQSVDE